MKLALSALLLSTALTAPLCAQAGLPTPDAPPPPPGVQHDGSHGPHSPGMFGPRMEAHRAEPIPNSPFTAQYTATSSFTTRDGKQEQRTSTSTIYRDSQGRVREEITLPPPPPRPAAVDSNTAPQPPATPRGPHTMVVLLDPVAHTITRLNAERKTAMVQTVPADFFTRMTQREERREAGNEQHGNGNDPATHSDLGNKVFSGVSAKGKRTTLTLPARDGDTAHTITREVWYSPDAKFEVGSSETSERGSRTNTLTSFAKAEPDAALFKVPAGYTTQTAPEQGFGGRHHGPGGPEAQGSHGTRDNDAPPPPSM